MDQLTTQAPVPAVVGTEMNVATASTAAMHEIQGAILVAKKFPRDMNKVFASLMTSCQRKQMAEIANYNYPRGGRDITGPSVNLARVAAQCYGNVRFGLSTMWEDADNVLIEGWAWDVENNTKVALQDKLKKSIQRKKNGVTVWVTPDERDLRELINRRGAILVRNALLQVLPKDLIDDAVKQCAATIREGLGDPRFEIKKLILQFRDLGVNVDMLNKVIGGKDWTLDDIVRLKGIFTSISEGNTKWSHYAYEETEKPGPEKKTTAEKLDEKLTTDAEPQATPGESTGAQAPSATAPAAEQGVPPKAETPPPESTPTSVLMDKMKPELIDLAFKELDLATDRYIGEGQVTGEERHAFTLDVLDTAATEMKFPGGEPQYRFDRLKDRNKGQLSNLILHLRGLYVAEG